MDEFSFSEWLTQELKDQHMTGKALSEKAFISLHSIYKYKDGQRSPTILMANDILNALGKRFTVVEKGRFVTTNPRQMEPITACDRDTPFAGLWYVCPVCRTAIDKHDRFCRHCGQALCWEGIK